MEQNKKLSMTRAHSNYKMTQNVEPGGLMDQQGEHTQEKKLPNFPVPGPGALSAPPHAVSMV